MVSSNLAVTSVSPSGENATDLIRLIISRTAPRCCPAFTSHSRTVSSPLPEANTPPSDENATQYTVPWCPARTARCFATATSHSLTVRSPLADANSFPSGEKATAQTSSSWPFKVTRSLPVVASQSRIVLSQPASRPCQWPAPTKLMYRTSRRSPAAVRRRQWQWARYTQRPSHEEVVGRLAITNGNPGYSGPAVLSVVCGFNQGSGTTGLRCVTFLPSTFTLTRTGLPRSLSLSNTTA